MKRSKPQIWVHNGREGQLTTGITSRATSGFQHHPATKEQENMTRIRLVGLVLVAVCAIGVSTAASAGASTFLLLRTVKARIFAKALATQAFATTAGTIECSALSMLGEITAKHSLTLEVTAHYTSCKAFGLAATVSPALYELSTHGSVKVLNAITINATGCAITVPSGQTLSTIKYTNKGLNDIELKPSVTGITSSGVGPACEYASESKGTYTGAALVRVEGGVGVEIEWTA